MVKVLIGFMGSGKTTIASLLSPKSRDMDLILAEQFGMSVSDFFDLHGEEAFRACETRLLSSLILSEGWLASGGGLIEKEVNRQLLKQAEEVVYLMSDFETLYQRLRNDKQNDRPLFKNNSKTDLENVFQRRARLYQDVATITIDVTGKTLDNIVEDIRQKIGCYC